MAECDLCDAGKFAECAQEELRAKVHDLRARIATLAKDLEFATARVSYLHGLNECWATRFEKLQKENAKLRERDLERREIC